LVISNLGFISSWSVPILSMNVDSSIRAIIDLIYIQSLHQFSTIKDIKTTIYNNSTGINQCKEANISK
jgi:hypothetical protein